MSEQDRIKAAERYIRALRSGEGSAAQRAAPHLAGDVVLTSGNSELKGYDAVLAHITGLWPNTAVYLMGGWGDPVSDGDQVVVVAEFPAFGAGAAGMTVTFGFNDEDQIQTVLETPRSNPRPEPQKEIPLATRGLLNSALANGTPIVLAYVNADGEAELSLRGSLQVFSPTQISAWLRNAEGGLTKALETNPKISLLYRDSRTRSTVIINGNGHIETDEAVRNRVFEISPEVEQMHDPQREGAALIIDVTRMRGGTPKGAINVQI